MSLLLLFYQNTKCPTFERVGAVVKLKLEDIVRGAVGIQRCHARLTATNETMLSTEHNDWPVDQLHEEQLGLPYREPKMKRIYEIDSQIVLI